MMIEAVLDANVLYSAALRDFLLRLAASQLIQPYWSTEIQNEWARNLRRNRRRSPGMESVGALQNAAFRCKR